MIFPIFSGAIYCCLAVMLGAFGAHGLKELITPERMEVYQTAVQYQFYHGLALIAIGCMPKHSLLNYAVGFFKTGIVVFSGSLYLLVMTDITKFGMITPIGGICFMIAWIFVAIAAFKLRNSPARFQQST